MPPATARAACNPMYTRHRASASLACRLLCALTQRMPASPQISRLLAKSEESDQFLLVLDLVLEGILSVIAGPTLR